MKKTLLSILAMVLLMSLIGCTPSDLSGAPEPDPAPVTAQPSAEPDWIITVLGLAEQVTISSEDVDTIGIDTVTIAMKDKDSTGPEEEWSGLQLVKVLEYLGVDTYTTVAVEAADGYSREYTPDIAENEGTLLGLKINGEALDDTRGPVQLVVDGKGSNWWIKQVVKLTINK